MRIFALIALCLATPASAQTCTLEFTIEVTQGVGLIRPGTELPGSAEFVTSGQTFRQEGGTMAHYATGQMTIGDGITGEIWTLITTSRGSAADLVGVYAHDVEGFSFAGQDFDGPMALTLFGPPGTRPTATPPVMQVEWDEMNLRRAFMLHADGDMLAGDVIDLTVECI
ncbi:hypothetical protein KUL25_18855 [Rhodobacteraceae bacterium N5(2021)]|uniref:DUF3237 domain-containing protein n=1 Tax=Gymnodinialimonas phycosphaerae TaxID=2841589 RepID=A0A975TU25_9RHOB|nr:hypothetical protein [Gymnodinialimonas phycosphaerae]MBY4894822.1 hypothetical protein [Gymnodinialimonas phycosphaerae]